ncbi:MAG: hypothetical protein ACI9LM_005322 [Alteromonadaceae bacterium]
MRTLYLHVGQDKTGSSYIQSSLAASVCVLKDEGIFYPVNKKVLKAKDGKISSGNMGLLDTNLEREYKELGEKDSILISGEQLFRFLPDEAYSSKLQSFVEKFEISEVKILLFIRDPIDHASSAYQQAIKRGGFTQSIEEFAIQYKHTKKVYEFIKYCETNSNYIVEIKNYSLRKKSIINEFESWLGITSGILIKPQQTIVNRSMTNAELEFQRVANIYLGREASFISDALCEQTPEIKADKVNVPLKAQETIVRNVQSFCEYVNDFSKKLNHSDLYSYEVIDSLDVEPVYNFNTNQIRVIASEMVKNLKDKTTN